MTEELTLSQVVSRLHTLEETVQTISAKLSDQESPLSFEFVIRVNDQEVWAGLDLETTYPQICQQYPPEQISIGWRSAPVVLV